MKKVSEEQLKLLLKGLIKLPNETEWVEFKENNSDPKVIGEYISALSNSACLHDKEKAYLVYGIADIGHEVEGTNFKPKQSKIGNQELENWIATQLNPRVDFVIHEFEYESKPIVLFEIQPTFNTPVAFKNVQYIRVGSYKKNLADFPEKLRKIWSKDNLTTFEDEFAIKNADADEVLKLIDYPEYFNLMNFPLPPNKDSILEKLCEEEIIKKEGTNYNITNLGAILFARNLNDFDRLFRKAVRVILYKGKNRLQTIREQVGVKGYAVGFEGLIDFINDKLPINEEIGKAFRKEVKMYPELAIRELVANAIIHQDFRETGSGPMVEVFDDRIEISNPGKPLIDPLRFIDHSPKSRNEKLASLMRRMNICEERGSGIDKVINESETYQLPAPKFIEENTSMKVTMYSFKKLINMDKQDKIRACYQHCCLKYVSNESMTNSSLRERFKISEKNYSTASRIIADTIEADLIKDYDPDNNSKKYKKYIPIWA